MTPASEITPLPWRGQFENADLFLPSLHEEMASDFSFLPAPPFLRIRRRFAESPSTVAKRDGLSSFHRVSSACLFHAWKGIHLGPSDRHAVFPFPTFSVSRRWASNEVFFIQEESPQTNRVALSFVLCPL